MNKQIKELSYLVTNCIIGGKTAQETAEYLYEKGYRQRKDTIKEIMKRLADENR